MSDFDESKFYLGTLCNHGHDYQGTGKSLRYKKTAKCVVCRKEMRKRYYEKSRDKAIEYNKQWYKENKNKVSEYGKRYREENRDKVSEYQRRYQKRYSEKNKGKVLELKKRSREALKDHYVKTLISNQFDIRTDKIPPELVEFKRHLVKKYRIMRDIKKGLE